MSQEKLNGAVDRSLNNRNRQAAVQARASARTTLGGVDRRWGRREGARVHGVAGQAV
jgi:hypothetical protein